MSDKKDMILAALLAIDQLAVQFAVLDEIYTDFRELSEALIGYRDDFMQRARIAENDFAAYKRMVLNEIGSDAVE
jgi:hypothetical protein